MSRPLRIVLAFLLALLPIACNDGDNGGGPTSPSTTGSVFVTVQSSSAQIVGGATVLTRPETDRYTTNAVGTVLLEDLPVGTYVVTATHPSIGTGNAAITVQPGVVQNLTIGLVSGVFLQPLVSITSPYVGQEFSFVEAVSLDAVVSDDLDAPETLSVQWTSDRDGELSTAPANPNGTIHADLAGLSLGDHLITLSVTDSDGFVGTDTVPVTVRSFSPQITSFSPDPGAGYVPGETVSFRATVSDRETAADQLAVQWRSDLDGVLDESPAAADGTVGFDTATLSRGVHQITLSVTDADSNESNVTRQILNNLPQRVVLSPLNRDAGGILLDWAPVTEPDFESYRVYRSTSQNGPFDLIQIFNDSLLTNYRDTAVTFGVTYWYRIGLRTTTGTESDSNVESIEAGIAIDVATQVEAMLVDPARPYLYALDRINNSMLFVNLDTNQLEKTIFVGSSPVDLDINAAGTELFIANFGSNQIAVVNLDTQEIARNISVDTSVGIWDGNPYRLACLTNGHLAYVSEDQWVDLKIVRQSDGALITSGGTIYQPDLEATPDDSKMFLGESGISRSQILRYEVAGSALSQTDAFSFGSYTSRSVVMSGDGTYVFYGRHKFLTSNLSSDLGTFPEVIWECNSTGSIAIGENKIYDGNTFSILQDLPVSTRTMVLAPDDSVLYLYDNSSSKIFLFDLSTVGP